MSECQHCSLTPEEHEVAAAASASDYEKLLQVAEDFPHIKEQMHKVLSDWRSHALPECDPLAIS